MQSDNANILASGTLFGVEAVAGSVTSAVAGAKQYVMRMSSGRAKPVVTNPTRQAYIENIMADVDKWSLSPIGDRQKGMIADKLGTVKQRTKEQAELIREKGFTKKRQRELIQQWQKETSAEWPKGATPHHVIPLKSGGSNEWWNLIPVKHPHTGTIHGTGSALRTELPYSIEPGTITEIK